MPKIIAVVIVVLIAGVLLFAATGPDSFRFHRTASIKAPPEQIFPFINDLHCFNTWNPYEKKDPGMKGSYSGPGAGQGAAYAFAGNKDVGKGSIEITESSSPNKVSMRLTMIEPFEARNHVEFTLEPKGETTAVTWAIEGPVPYLMKIVHLFFNMDRMVGRDFEAGLASLKAAVEHSG
jgi:carbon monoxide dehydrogenase subunit G